MKIAVALFLLASMMVIGAVYGSSQSPFGLPSGISGAGVAYINVTDSITQSSSAAASVSVTYDIRYNGSGNLNFTLIEANAIKLLNDGNTYPFSRIPSSMCSVFLQESINCTTIVISNVTYGDAFVLSYNHTVNYVPNSMNIFNYTFIFIPSSPTQLSVETVLPQGAFLPNISRYSPSYAKFASNEKSIEAVWSLFQVTSAPVPLPFSISYELNSFVPKTSQAPINTSYVVMIVVIILVAVAVIILVKNKKRKEGNNDQKPRKRISPLLNILNDNERKILSLLKRDIFITQKELVIKTGFSKAKMSKILSKLSRLKLIRIRPNGRLNKIKRI